MSFFWTAAITATWTLYDGGARFTDLDARASDVRTIELRASSLRAQVTADVHDALIQVPSLERSLAARRQAELTRENEATIKARFDAGAATPLELSDAEDRRLTAEIGEVTSRASLRLARVVLDVAIGRDPSSAR